MTSEQVEEVSKNNSEKRLNTNSLHDHISSTKNSPNKISEYLNNEDIRQQNDHKNKQLFKKSYESVNFNFKKIEEKSLGSNFNLNKLPENLKKNEDIHERISVKNNSEDEEGNNKLNTAICKEVNDMNIDEVFSVLVDKVKEKKERNVESKKITDLLLLNNFISKGKLHLGKDKILISRRDILAESKVFLGDDCDMKTKINELNKRIPNLNNILTDKIINKSSKIIKNESNKQINHDNNIIKNTNENKLNKNGNKKSTSKKSSLKVICEMQENAFKELIEEKNDDLKETIMKTEKKEENKLCYPKEFNDILNKKSNSVENKKDLSTVSTKFKEIENDKNTKDKDLNNTKINLNDFNDKISSGLLNLENTIDSDETNCNHNSYSSELVDGSYYDNNTNFNNERALIRENPILKKSGDQDYLKKKRKNNNTEEKLEKNNIGRLNSKNYTLLNNPSNGKSSEITLINLSEDKTNINGSKIIRSLVESNNQGNKNTLKNEENLQEIFSRCLSKTVSSNNSSGFSEKFFNQKIKDFSILNSNKEKGINNFKILESKKNNLKKESCESSRVFSIIDNNKVFNSNNNCNNFNNNNSNYKVESNVNVNVNLVTFPAYFNNNDSNEKNTTKGESTINFKNSFPCFSNAFKNNFNSSVSSSNKIDNIPNFPNININNTLPQLHINPTTNFNNSNLNNNHAFNFTTSPNIGSLNSKNNQNIKNIIKKSKFLVENKNVSSKNEKQTENINCNAKGDFAINQNFVDINSFKKLLKKKKITFQETHQELDYILKFCINENNSSFEITVDNNNCKIINFISYDNKIGERVIEIKNINSDTNDMINFNFNKLTKILDSD